MPLTIIRKPSNSAFVGNSMIVTIGSDNLRDSNTNLRQKFKLGIILEIDTAGSYTAPIWEEKGRFEVSTQETNISSGIGRATFNISHILKALIRKYRQEPQANYSIDNSSFYSFDANNQIYYRFRYYEVHSDSNVVVPSLLDDSGILMAQLGGISDHEHNKTGNNIENYNGQFLTQHPRRKRSQDDTPEFLSFNVGTTPPLNQIISVKIQYTDGFVSAHPIYTLTATDPYKTITIATGYNQLDLESFNPTKTVKSWSILGVGTVGNDQITFIRDCRYFDCKNILIYENSMGCMESLFTTGKYSLDIDVKSSTALSLPDIDRSPRYDTRTVICEKTVTQEFRGRTGYVSKEISVYLQQFVTSEDVYWLTAYDGTVYESRPIIIDKDDFQITECWQYLHALTFDFKLTHSMRNYDNTLPIV